MTDRMTKFVSEELPSDVRRERNRWIVLPRISWRRLTLYLGIVAILFVAAILFSVFLGCHVFA